MSLSRYRATDLTILLLVMCAIEAISLFVLKRVGSQFVLSVIVPVTLIVYIRWNAFGLIHALVGGVLEAAVITYYNGDMTVFTLVRSATIYGAGYACTAAAMLTFIKGKDAVAGKWWSTALYALIAFVAMCIGRAVTATVFGEDFLDILLEYLLREALNLIFTILVLLIARRQNGFFADQKEYFYSARK